MRAGRTRYLVVVSRPASKKAQQVATTASVAATCASPNRNNNNNQLPLTTATTTTESITSHLNSNITDSCSSHADEKINQRRRSNEDIDDKSKCSISATTTSYQQTVNSFSANLTTTCDNEFLNIAQSCIAATATSSSSFNADDIQQCDNESTVGSSCSSKSSSNEIEESCLLGIDCNEKTTVGLVLKVLADTAIRLDGDG